MPFVVHVQDRLNSKHGAEQSGSSGDTPSTLEMVQVIYRKPMRKTVSVVFYPARKLFNVKPGPLLLDSVIDKEPLPHRSGKGIY